MVSPRGRRAGLDGATAGLCLLAMLAAGGSAGAQATARDPWPPGDATHRSHILVPALTRFPLEGEYGFIVEFPEAGVQG